MKILIDVEEQLLVPMLQSARNLNVTLEEVCQHAIRMATDDLGEFEDDFLVYDAATK